MRVAVIGAGPAGFYAAEHLLKQDDLSISVDLFDRLPTPHGLVRLGVAPDHQSIKKVTRVFDKTAARPQFRFFGNIEIGKEVTREDLQRHYHQICYTIGTAKDRKLGLPGEDLDGSHSATDFVAWYNGHPDYRDLAFDLSQERVAVIGVGNVAVDVARILARDPDHLATTDIADHALEALRNSRVKEIVMLGRRGPAQAAFTVPEAKELGQLDGADIHVLPEEAALDPISQADLDANPNRLTQKKVDLIQGFAAQQPTGKPKRLTLRFCVSPTAFLGDGGGHVLGLDLVKTEIYRTDDGRLRPRTTNKHETLPCGLVFRAVGYRGVPLDGLPFDDWSGTIPNVQGRIHAPDADAPVTGEYVAGWIKRGPTGVIGTNKPDAIETVVQMLADAAANNHLAPEAPEADAVEQTLRERKPNFVSYEDWLRLNELEVAKGTPANRPRVKFTSVEDMLQALREG